MTVLHGLLANSTVMYMFIAGFLGLFAFLRGRGVEGSYWGVLGIAELLFLAQVAIGVALLLSGAQPARSIHYLYGALGAVTLPGYYGLSKGRSDRPAALAYGLLCLFLAGIGMRAIGTA